MSRFLTPLVNSLFTHFGNQNIRRKQFVSVSRHKQRSVGFLSVALTLLIVVFGSSVSAQTANVDPPTGGFKIDGRLRASASVGDWVQGQGAGYVLNNDGTPVNEKTTGLARDLYNSSSDSIFTSGSKFNDYISALRWSKGTATSKDDINNGMYHVSVDDQDHQWLFIGGDRLSITGTSYIDFELLQGTVSVNPNGTFTGSGDAGTSGRTAGDLNISMEYTNGGSKPNVVIYTWAEKTVNGKKVWLWDSTGSAAFSAGQKAFAETNRDSAVNVPFGAFGANNTSYPQYSFVEAGIDVTAVLGNIASCRGIIIQTVWIKTKAAASSTAALKDFMRPISVHFEFTPAHITAVSPLCASDDPVALVGSPSGGTFSGNGVVAVTPSTEFPSGYKFDPSASGVNKGDGTAGDNVITYSVTIAGSCVSQPTITIHVSANPSVTVNSPTICESDGETAINATPSPAANGTTIKYSYAWTVPAGVTDPGDVSTFNSDVPGDYSVTITRIGSGCTGTGSGHLTVNPSPSQPVVSVTDPTCSVANGTVTVTAPLDDADKGINYEYSNNGGAFQDDVNFNVAAGGSYSIVARDKTTLCTSTAKTGTIGTSVATPDATAVITQQVDCSHSKGKVKIVQASEGNPEYDNTIYEFSNDGTHFGSNPEFEFVAGGGYNLTVRRISDPSCTASATCAGESSEPVSAARLGTVYEAQVELGTQTSVIAAPNPFSDKIRFSLKSAVSGKGTLELYNMLGQKIKTLYQGQVNAGQVQTIEYNVPGNQRANLIYVFTVGGQRTSGKLIGLK